MIRRRSLPDLLARAHVEIDRNPTITTYVWQDGREIRSRVEPWLSFRRSLQKIGRAFIRIEPEMRGFGASRWALDAMPVEPTGLPLVLRPTGPPQLLSVADSLSPAPPLEPVVLPQELKRDDGLGVAGLLRHHGVPVQFEDDPEEAES